MSGGAVAKNVTGAGDGANSREMQSVNRMQQVRVHCDVWPRKIMQKRIANVRMTAHVNQITISLRGQPCCRNRR